MPGLLMPTASRPTATARLAAVLLALLVALTGCTGGGAEPAGDPGSSGPPPVGAAATTTQGAELRAALTWLLTERVHLVLAHARTLQAAQGRRNEPAVVAAREAFTSSGRASVDVLGGTYSGARPELTPALREHDSALLEHTSALATGDERAASTSFEDLERERTELAESVRRVVPRLRTQDVEASLGAQTSATIDAVTAAVEASPRAPALQRSANEAAWSTARLLAIGVSSDRDLGLAGSPATELRGRLTGLLTEHVLLTGELASRLAAVGGDVNDPSVLAIVAALDAAAVSLAELVGRAAPETAQRVLTAWREHLGELRDIAVARATRQPPPAPPLGYLERLQAALAPLADATPPGAGDIGARAARSLQTAVEAAATASPSAPEALRAAAADTVAPAALLAAALAERQQLS
jgi:hypothetical protein